MISFAALGRFAAEFLVFLVAVGGLALVALRPELVSGRRGSRAVLAAGFSLIAVTGFLEGSLIVRDRSAPALVAARAVGVLAVALGSLRWAGGERSRRLLWIGLVATIIAAALFASGVGPGADVALGIGGVGLGVALRVASGRSIAARVAANSAAILLLVVLVLSVSLSAVLAKTVRDDAGRRLDARVAAEADFAEKTQPENAVVVARNVAFTFATNTAFITSTNALVDSGNLHSGVLPRDQAVTFRELQQFLAPNFAFAYINSTGHAYGLAAPQGFDQGVVAAAIGSQDVQQAFANPIGGQRSSVGVFNHSAFVVAVQTVARRLPDGSVDYPTAVVVVEPLDNGYLSAERQPLDPKVSLAIVSRTAVLASAGNAGTAPGLLALAKRTLDADGQPIALTNAGGLLSATGALYAGSQPVAVLVASTPATVFTDVR
ncbi:MAG TPA: hypothetical protein VGI06_05785, partial [Acidimicrobiales bacterium]